MNKSELSGKTVQELKALVKASGLKGFATLRKAELVDLLATSGSGRADSRTPERATGKKVAGKDAGKKPVKDAGKKPATDASKKAAGTRKASSEPALARAADREEQTGRGLAPRTRRAFSIYRTMGEERIKASKYYLGAQEASDIDDGFTFPQTYGEDLAVLMVRDPYWLFAYWEFSPDLNDNLIARLGEETLRNSRLVLRVYDVTGTDADNPLGYHDIDVAPGARDWYINVTHVESDYCIDIGLILPDGSFVVIARSNRVSLPPIGPSAEVDEQWVTLESLGEIYSIDERGPTSGSGGWGSGGWGQG
ncbi:MAG: DUF4912 domain-containing protein [Candidatus Eisenbacteria bacterium]